MAKSTNYAMNLFSDEEYLDTIQESEEFNIPKRTLESMRQNGGGPPYIKVGSRVLYPKRLSKEWMQDRLCTSTSDYGGKQGVNR